MKRPCFIPPLLLKPGLKTLLLLGLVAFLGTARADVVTLKSGEKVEGKVLSETAKELTMDVKVSAGITDQRVIAKTDIVTVQKASPDEEVYQPLKAIKLGANSLPAAQYDQLLNPLRAFLAQFPSSTHLAEVQKTADAVEAEKKRVDAGEVKLSEKWLSKDEAQKERYQINGQIVLNYMREQRARGDSIGALNSFDQLEKNYPGARTFPDAVELARQILGELNAYVTRRQPQLKAEMDEAQKGLDAASDAQKTELTAARQREQAVDEAKLSAAERAGQPWMPLIPRSEKSLTGIAGKVPGELQRLGEQPVAKMRQSLQLAEKARGQLAAKEFDAAETSLREAADLWQPNEIATRLEAELALAKTTAATPAEPEPDPAKTAAETAAMTPAPAIAATSTEDEGAQPQEEAKPFYQTTFGIVAILLGLIVVLVALTIFKKMKARANPELE